MLTTIGFTFTSFVLGGVAFWAPIYVFTYLIIFNFIFIII